MKFCPLSLSGAYLIEPTLLTDERGAFARTYCQGEFQKKGLNARWEQCSFSYNAKQGTLRGMHFQRFPHEETKMVRCTQGKIYDVIVDLRPNSPTFLKWQSVLLSADNRNILYIPQGLAHGFLTLQNDTEVFYQISCPYAPEYASGVRWNDAAFGIQWPEKIQVISEKDQLYPDFI